MPHFRDRQSADFVKHKKNRAWYNKPRRERDVSCHAKQKFNPGSRLLITENEISYTVSDNGAITVRGWLDLRGAPITALPDNLTVRGGLNLRGAPITRLPDNLTVGGLVMPDGTEKTL